MHVIENAQLVGEQALWQENPDRMKRETLMRRPPDEISTLLSRPAGGSREDFAADADSVSQDF
jgi:hypothetical protein